MRRISFDQVAHRYDETRRLPEEQMERAVDALFAELSGHDRVLEVGVGTGRFAVPLQERGLHVIGIDIAPKMLNQARRKGLSRALLGDALSLPFRDKAFGACYSVHLLHLIEAWKEALREFARVTRDVYCTVATYRHEARTPYRIYWESIRESVGRPAAGVFERDLPEVIPPAKRIALSSFETRKRAEEMIRNLAERCFSSQWSLSEEVHRRAMEVVRREFSDEVVVVQNTLELIVWRAEDLTPP